MSNFNFTGSAKDIDAFCKASRLPAHEGRLRYAGYSVLSCISMSPALRAIVAFKRGNALRFFYGNPRSTVDLDFTAVGDFLDDADFIARTLNEAFRNAGRFALKLKYQKIERKPREGTMPTYCITIAYAYSADRVYKSFESAKPNPQVVNLEILLNDLVCAFQDFRPLASEPYTLKVCSLEDIIAEKLRSLLQQKTRHRYRAQDAYDLARINRDFGSTIDFEKVYYYFAIKSRARGIVPDRREFDVEVRSMASYEYEKRMMKQVPDDFIPFEQAWNSVMTIVDKIPASE